ncbi:MAG: hypothetical protein B1H11_06820 [Desulfobacteraceae bacterium 4484_190.1]|nr:MAG: hypothetical protein B1H11_06820 [Desulfobacteraceae bacterium 4484_190.1]
MFEKKAHFVILFAKNSLRGMALAASGQMGCFNGFKRGTRCLPDWSLLHQRMGNQGKVDPMSRPILLFFKLHFRSYLGTKM